MTPSTHAKAARIVAEGKVTRLTNVEVFDVQGDHDTYTVLIRGGHATCTCPARTTCSHIAAAGLLRIRERRPADPFARFEMSEADRAEAMEAMGAL